MDEYVISELCSQAINDFNNENNNSNSKEETEMAKKNTVVEETEVMENTNTVQEDENMENTEVMNEVAEDQVEAEEVEAAEEEEEQATALIAVDENGEEFDITECEFEIITLDKSNQPFTCEQIWKNINSGKFTFDNTVQRTNVWTPEQQSLLIHSLISKMPIPSLYCNQLAGGIRDFFDGKQRCEAIRAYRNDEFALKGVPVVKIVLDDDSVMFLDINGKKYSELPAVIQDVFRNASLTVFSYQNDDGTELDEEQTAEVFYRMNNGTPLTKIEITRVKAVSYDKIKEAAKHEVFDEMFTEKQRKKYANEDTVMKAFMLLKNDNPCLDNKELRPFVENVILTDEDVENMNQIFDLIMDAHTIMTHDVEKVEDTAQKKRLQRFVKRLYTRTHFISVVPTVARAIEDGRDSSELADFFGYFFSNTKATSVSDLYNSGLLSGSNHAPSVQKRLDGLKAEYEKFFENYTGRDEKSEDEQTA